MDIPTTSAFKDSLRQNGQDLVSLKIECWISSETHDLTRAISNDLWKRRYVEVAKQLEILGRKIPARY